MGNGVRTRNSCVAGATSVKQRRVQRLGEVVMGWVTQASCVTEEPGLGPGDGNGEPGEVL